MGELKQHQLPMTIDEQIENLKSFVDEEYHRAFMADIEEEVRRNSKAPFVRNFKTNYAGGGI